MAQRYGVLPSELMNLGLLDFSFNLRVWKIGLEKDIQNKKREEAEMKAKNRKR